MKLSEPEQEILMDAVDKLHEEIREWRVRAVAAEAELREARSEITRHHRDFALVQLLAEKAAACLDKDLYSNNALDMALVGCYVGSARTWVRDIRNIVG